MTTVTAAFDDELARLRERPARTARTPLLVLLGVWLARLVVGLARARTVALSIGGFGFLCAAAWMVALPLGLAAVGVSLLVLEWLSAPDGRR